MRTSLIDLINMRTSLICKLFSLDSVTSWSNMAAGVNNLNPFSLDAPKTNMADVRTILNLT